MRGPFQKHAFDSLKVTLPCCSNHSSKKMLAMIIHLYIKQTLNCCYVIGTRIFSLRNTMFITNRSTLRSLGFSRRDVLNKPKYTRHRHTIEFWGGSNF